MKLEIVLLVLASEALLLGNNNPFLRDNSGVNGLPGITIIDARAHTPRGVRNSIDFHLMPRPNGALQLVPSEAVVLTYHRDWFSAHALDDPMKVVNPTYIQQNAFIYVRGDPRQEVVIQFSTGQLAVIKRSLRPNAPMGNLIGLGRYASVVGLRSIVIQNRLGNPVQTRPSNSGGEEWLYYQEVTQRAQRTVTSNQVTSGMIGNDFVDLNTTSATFVTVQRPLVLWNFTISFKSDSTGDLRVTSMTSGQTGPGEWKVVPAP